MDKLVYLHALDSVRNSPEEIAHGREALFQEVVLNGDIPIISFNQLTDSRAFLGLVMRDEEMLETVEALMRNGRIRISRYSDKRTASQYLQDGLDPRTHSKRSQFILSGWDLPRPVNESAADDRGELLESIYYAMKNNEPTYVLRHSDDEERRRSAGFASESANVSENQRESMLRYPHADLMRIVRLIKLVQFISATDMGSTTYVVANQDPVPSFLDFMECVLSYADADPREADMQSDDPLADLELQEALRLLAVMQTEIGSSEADSHSRSSWYNALYSRALLRGQLGEKILYTSAEERAFQVIDLCYNFTVEASISGSSIHYDPTQVDEDGGFSGELRERLAAYEELYKRLGHEYYQGPDSAELLGTERGRDDAPDGGVVRKWRLAGHVADAVIQRSSRRKEAEGYHADKGSGAPDEPESSAKTDRIELYEFRQSEQRKSWQRRVYSSLLKQISVFVLYVLVFVGLEISISLVQDMFNANAGSETGLADMLSSGGSISALTLFVVGIVLYYVLSQRIKGVVLPFFGILAVYLIVLPLLVYIDALITRPEDVADVFAFFSETLQAMLPTICVTFVSVLIFGIFGMVVEDGSELPGLFESVRLLKPSVVSLVGFAMVSKKMMVVFFNPLTARGIKNGICAGLIDPSLGLWERFGVMRQGSTGRQRGSKQWNEYVDWYVAHDAGRLDGLTIVDDIDKVRAFEWEEGKQIGIRYASPYHKLIVDLVEDDGRQFAYERLVPVQEGAAVIVAMCKGDFVLLDQYRHAIGGRQICFPRGFGEPNIAPAANACKELREETGIRVDEADMKLLGYVTPDSGVQGTRVAVFACETDEEPTDATSEQIREIRRIPPEEFAQMVENGEVEDGFTLSAYALWSAKRTPKSC